MVLTHPHQSPLPLVYDGTAVTEGKEALTDQFRDNLKLQFSAAEKLMMQVYVQHPNYAHIINALLATGLTDLAERVPLEIGSLTTFSILIQPFIV
jgi:hypothetical protein